MPKQTAGVFWGVLLAFLAITVMTVIVNASRRQQQENEGVASTCRKMEATGGGSYADCLAQMKKMGY